MFQHVAKEICPALQIALWCSRLRARDKAPTSSLNEIAVKTDRLVAVLNDYHFPTGNRKPRYTPSLNPKKAH